MFNAGTNLQSFEGSSVHFWIEETGFTNVLMLHRQSTQFNGVGWDRVNLLCNSSYDAVLWICDQNSVGNAPMF